MHSSDPQTDQKVAKNTEAASTTSAANALASTLKPEQQRTLEALLTGRPIAEAARQSGVHRSTIYAWLKQDVAFLAAYNQWQEEMKENARVRLLAMMDTAADAVEMTIGSGDGRLGMRLLEKMGMAREQKTGITDAAEIVNQKNLAKKTAELRQEAEANNPGHEETTDDDSLPEPEFEPKVG